ncbi:hypothetical protein [Burkholderia seminalis]|uniref:MmyB family transcriptional regulator n=1 Tax=Burkholderia seminalis TaxID=488731 RepID=UPI000A7F7B0B|nr:hypothetical protein [Burkholderia seminalis]MCA8039547.1 hypothetical protein [Burkholderia seminalis]MCA8429041.1 hypothetical protein [Burkholderia seminalis]
MRWRIASAAESSVARVRDRPALSDFGGVVKIRKRAPDASSVAFAQGWDAHDVRSGVSGEKVLVHAQRGTQRYEYATFQANDDPALKLAIYTPMNDGEGG